MHTFHVAVQIIQPPWVLQDRQVLHTCTRLFVTNSPSYILRNTVCYSISTPNYYKDGKRIQQQGFTNEIMYLPNITRQTSNSFDKYDVSILHINALQDIFKPRSACIYTKYYHIYMC